MSYKNLTIYIPPQHPNTDLTYVRIKQYRPKVVIDDEDMYHPPIPFTSKKCDKCDRVFTNQTNYGQHFCYQLKHIYKNIENNCRQFQYNVKSVGCNVELPTKFDIDGLNELTEKSNNLAENMTNEVAKTYVFMEMCRLVGPLAKKIYHSEKWTQTKQIIKSFKNKGIYFGHFFGLKCKYKTDTFHDIEQTLGKVSLCK